MFLAGYIARRLSLRPDDGKKRRSPGVVIAVTGIALAIAIMLMAISIVTGFKKEIKDNVTGFNAQITIYPADAFSDTTASSGIKLTDSLRTFIHDAAPSLKPALTIKQPAIFKTDDAFQGLVLKSSDSADLRSFLEANLVKGAGLPETTDADSTLNTVVISSQTASALGLDVGQKINVHFLRDNNISTRRLSIVGIYDTHFSEYDKLYAFTPLRFLQRFNRVDSITGSAIELCGIDNDDIRQTASHLEGQLLLNSISTHGAPTCHLENVLDSCALYFNWLDLLDTNVTVIIVLMTLVASFTLISSLFIIILERVNMIGLFKALGATNTQIRKIFIYLAERIVMRGLLAGNIIGLGILLAQQQFHIFPLDPEAYYLNFVPVYINWWHVALVNICALVVSVAVLIIPSSAIARMSPSTSMRYE